MIDVNLGFDALRRWNQQRAQQRENASPADVAALKAALRARRTGIDDQLTRLHRDGVAFIENFWSAEQCARSRDELDRLIQNHPESVRVFSGGSDKRMFGSEMAGPQIRAFHDDPVLKAIGEIEGGFSIYNLVTLGARIDATANNRGSGDGWHRDAFGYQFKALLYLSDVTDDNGPFEYMAGSHKLWRVGLDSALKRFPAPPESRIDRDHVDRLVERGVLRPRRFPARAGTVILANTAGVHGGAPLKSGSRYALTNYYYFPYQIGKGLVDKFAPLVPGVRERLAGFLEAEHLPQ
jgi:hypothetical protein